MKKNSTSPLMRGITTTLLTLSSLFTSHTVHAQPVAQPVQPQYKLSVLRKMLGGHIFQRAPFGLGLSTLFKNCFEPPNGNLYALAQYIYPRAYPNDSINYSAEEAAILHQTQMQGGPLKMHFNNQQSSNAQSMAVGPLGFVGGGTLNGYWNQDGPVNMPPPYEWGFGNGDMIGRVNDAVIDPNNPDTIYIASAGGGVWKSIDGGNSWVPLSDKWPLLPTSCVVVDPANSNVVYCGTGDILGGPGIGIMKSTNGGQSWTSEGQSIFGTNSVRKVLVDVNNSNTILAGYGGPGAGGIARSTDGGTTWTSVLQVPGTISDIAYSIPNAQGQRYLYASSENGGNAGGIYRSSNDGLTWSLVGANMGIGTCDVAPSATDANTVYAYDYYHQTVMMSTTAGSSWTDIGGSLSQNGGAWGQGWYDYYIRCSQQSGHDVVYVGLLDIWEYNGASVGGVPQWTSLLNTYNGNDLAHTDQHGMEFDPHNPAHMLIGNDGGVYSMTVNGTTASTTSLNAGLVITQFYGVDINPAEPGWILGGCQDNGSETSNVGGPGNTDTSSWTAVGGGDGFMAIIDSTNPATQYYTVYDNSITETMDYWAGQFDISPTITAGEPQPFYTPLYKDPNQSVIFTATDHLYKYNANTFTWTADLGGTKLTSGGLVDVVAVAPSNSNVIYTGSNDGKIYMSTNGGTSWNAIDGSKFFSVSSIDVLASNPNSILVGGNGVDGGHVYTCLNTASPTWNNIDGTGLWALPNMYVTAVARNPYDPTNVLYAGTDNGLFYTTDGGAQWYSANKVSNLPDAQVTQIHATMGTGVETGKAFLTVSTFGRGAWQTFLTDLMQITNISPATLASGAPTTTISINGMHFNSWDKVEWNGNQLQTTFLGSGSLQAVIPATDLAIPGTYNVSVLDPNSGQSSNSYPFTVQQGYRQTQLSFTVVNATKLSTGQLQVALSVHNTGITTVQNMNVMYAALRGWVKIGAAFGSTQLAPGATTTLTLTFPSRVPSGNDMLLMMVGSNYGMVSTIIPVNVP